MVEIIVLTFNQPDATIECFNSILKNTKQKYRLVWVDNGSVQESRDKIMPHFLKHKNRIPIWSQNNLGFVKGVNLGLKTLIETIKTKSKYIVIQNNDTIVAKEWLSQMINVAEENEKNMAVGPVSSVKKSTHDWRRVFKENNIKIKKDFNHLNLEDKGSFLINNFKNQSVEALENLLEPKVKMVAFFCTLFKKKIFEHIGFLDNIYDFGLCDDRDFCTRIYQKGFNCKIALGSYVEHNHQTTFRSEFKNFEISKMHQKNIKKFKKKFNL